MHCRALMQRELLTPLSTHTHTPRTTHIPHTHAYTHTQTLDQAAGLVNGARGVVLRLSGQARLPTIRFMNGLEATISPERYSAQLGGREVALRYQLPLDLAWAISIHKSQGQSLDAVEVELRATFEVGQAYVALSRARSLGGLVLVSRFEPSCVVRVLRRGSPCAGERGC